MNPTQQQQQKRQPLSVNDIPTTEFLPVTSTKLSVPKLSDQRAIDIGAAFSKFLLAPSDDFILNRAHKSPAHQLADDWQAPCVGIVDDALGDLLLRNFGSLTSSNNNHNSTSAASGNVNNNVKKSNRAKNLTRQFLAAKAPEELFLTIQAFYKLSHDGTLRVHDELAVNTGVNIAEYFLLEQGFSRSFCRMFSQFRRIPSLGLYLLRLLVTEGSVLASALAPRQLPDLEKLRQEAFLASGYDVEAAQKQDYENPNQSKLQRENSGSTSLALLLAQKKNHQQNGDGVDSLGNNHSTQQLLAAMKSKASVSLMDQRRKENVMEKLRMFQVMQEEQRLHELLRQQQQQQNNFNKNSSKLQKTSSSNDNNNNSSKTPTVLDLSAYIALNSSKKSETDKKTDFEDKMEAEMSWDWDRATMGRNRQQIARWSGSISVLLATIQKSLPDQNLVFNNNNSGISGEVNGKANSGGNGLFNVAMSAMHQQQQRGNKNNNNNNNNSTFAGSFVRNRKPNVADNTNSSSSHEASFNNANTNILSPNSQKMKVISSSANVNDSAQGDYKKKNEQPPPVGGLPSEEDLFGVVHLLHQMEYSSSSAARDALEQCITNLAIGNKILLPPLMRFQARKPNYERSRRQSVSMGPGDRTGSGRGRGRGGGSGGGGATLNSAGVAGKNNNQIRSASAGGVATSSKSKDDKTVTGFLKPSSASNQTFSGNLNPSLNKTLSSATFSSADFLQDTTNSSTPTNLMQSQQQQQQQNQNSPSFVSQNINNNNNNSLLIFQIPDIGLEKIPRKRNGANSSGTNLIALLSSPNSNNNNSNRSPNSNHNLTNDKTNVKSSALSVSPSNQRSSSSPINNNSKSSRDILSTSAANFSPSSTTTNISRTVTRDEVRNQFSLYNSDSVPHGKLVNIYIECAKIHALSMKPFCQDLRSSKAKARAAKSESEKNYCSSTNSTSKLKADRGDIAAAYQLLHKFAGVSSRTGTSDSTGKNQNDDNSGENQSTSRKNIKNQNRSQNRLRRRRSGATNSEYDIDDYDDDDTTSSATSGNFLSTANASLQNSAMIAPLPTEKNKKIDDDDDDSSGMMNNRKRQRQRTASVSFVENQIDDDDDEDEEEEEFAEEEEEEEEEEIERDEEEQVEFMEPDDEIGQQLNDSHDSEQNGDCSPTRKLSTIVPLSSASKANNNFITEKKSTTSPSKKIVATSNHKIIIRLAPKKQNPLSSHASVAPPQLDVSLLSSSSSPHQNDALSNDASENQITTNFMSDEEHEADQNNATRNSLLSTTTSTSEAQNVEDPFANIPTFNPTTTVQTGASTALSISCTPSLEGFEGQTNKNRLPKQRKNTAVGGKRRSSNASKQSNSSSRRNSVATNGKKNGTGTRSRGGELKNKASFFIPSSLAMEENENGKNNKKRADQLPEIVLLRPFVVAEYLGYDVDQNRLNFRITADTRPRKNVEKFCSDVLERVTAGEEHAEQMFNRLATRFLKSHCCPKHKSLQLSHFCATCDVLVCESCIVEIHPTHEVVAKSAYCTQKIAQMTPMKEMFEKRIALLQTLRSQVVVAEERLMASVDSAREECRVVLESRRTELKADAVARGAKMQEIKESEFKLNVEDLARVREAIDIVQNSQRRGVLKTVPYVELHLPATIKNTTDLLLPSRMVQQVVQSLDWSLAAKHLTQVVYPSREEIQQEEEKAKKNQMVPISTEKKKQIMSASQNLARKPTTGK